MKQYVLGLDGGGTKTAVLATDLSGKELLRLQGGPMNLNGQTPEAVQQVIIQLIRNAATQIGPAYELAGICIGAAGISNASAQSLIRSAVQETGFYGTILLTGDHTTALAGALGHAEGIILISGTGSICAGRTQEGKEARAGGRGHIIDDGGSGYAMGIDILHAVIEAEDGRGPSTCLTEAVHRSLQTKTVEDIVSFVHTPNRAKHDIADLARLLPEALEQQDAVAMDIYQKAAFQLSRLVTAVATRLNYHTGEVALAGSALQNSAYLRTCLYHDLQKKEPELTLVLPRHDAAWGAAYLARSAAEEKER